MNLSSTGGYPTFFRSSSRPRFSPRYDDNAWDRPDSVHRDRFAAATPALYCSIQGHPGDNDDDPATPSESDDEVVADRAPRAGGVEEAAVSSESDSSGPPPLEPVSEVAGVEEVAPAEPAPPVPEQPPAVEAQLPAVEQPSAPAEAAPPEAVPPEVEGEAELQMPEEILDLLPPRLTGLVCGFDDLVSKDRVKNKLIEIFIRHSNKHGPSKHEFQLELERFVGTQPQPSKPLICRAKNRSGIAFGIDSANIILSGLYSQCAKAPPQPPVAVPAVVHHQQHQQPANRVLLGALNHLISRGKIEEFQKLVAYDRGNPEVGPLDNFLDCLPSQLEQQKNIFNYHGVSVFWIDSSDSEIIKKLAELLLKYYRESHLLSCKPHQLQLVFEEQTERRFGLNNSISYDSNGTTVVAFKRGCNWLVFQQKVANRVLDIFYGLPTVRSQPPQSPVV